MRAKESQLLDTHKRLVEPVAVFDAELRAAQLKLANLTLPCDGAHGHVKKLTAERDAAAARDVTAIDNLRTARIARDVLSRDITSARLRVNRMEAVLINFCNEVEY